MAVEEKTKTEISSFEPKPFGRYVLLDKLAVGGMAEIYKAKTYGVDGFEKLLAIKRILPHCAADKEFISMLIDEAKLTVLLSHANIVQVFDLGKVGDDYFISMEFINGTNLREVLTRLSQEGEKVPEEIAVFVMSECCKGLDYAHRKTDPQGIPLNIVHRDISPQNVLVSYEGEIKIVDFGIAKAAMNVSHTMAGILKGKIAYMSPEQALGKPIDHRTDTFSAGVVLYEMLTGEKLFTGETQFEVLNKIRTTRLNTSMLPEQIPAPLKAILCKALAYNAKDRYQSVGDFQLDLTKFLYSSYIDFSPRQLSALLRRLFAKEIARKISVPTLDEKTRSVLIKQAERENIMVHGTAQPRAVTTLKTAVSGVYSLPALKMAGRIAVGLGLLAVAAGVGYFGYRFFKPEPETETVRKTSPVETRILPPASTAAADDLGSFRISSRPVGARIFLNDADTGLTTPSSIRKLPLGKEYEIRLEKDQYKGFEKKFALITTEPIIVDETLEAFPLGVIDITSTPPGARIFLDGQPTGRATPSRVENLQVPKDYQIKLALEGHADWYGGVQVKDLEPVKLAATLTNLPKIEPTQAATPAAVTETPKSSLYGKLEIRSSPSQARILIDGRDTGRTTPATLDQLDSGRKYNITLQKEGYQSWNRRGLAIKENRTTDLTASLKTEKAEVKEEEKRPASPPGTAAVGGKAGSLKVGSDPAGADVYVNSEFKGTTPLTLSGVPSGPLKVLVSKQGYMKHTSNITLDSGELKSLGTIQLQGLFGDLSINSTPPRASIYFDGKLIPPKTPITINKVPRDRKHTIRLELEGYETWETTVDMSTEGSKKYNATLEKK